MKKIIGIFLAVVLCISMTACGSEPSEESTVGQESSPAVVLPTGFCQKIDGNQNLYYNGEGKRPCRNGGTI